MKNYSRKWIHGENGTRKMKIKRKKKKKDGNKIGNRKNEMRITDVI